MASDGTRLNESLDDSQGVEVKKVTEPRRLWEEEGNGPTSPLVEGVVHVSAVDLTVVTECHSEINVEVELASDQTLEGESMRGVDCSKHVDALRCKRD
jgi:hypothetical protein